MAQEIISSPKSIVTDTGAIATNYLNGLNLLGSFSKKIKESVSLGNLASLILQSYEQNQNALSGIKPLWDPLNSPNDSDFNITNDSGAAEVLEPPVND